jgi:hypothetical protein
MKRAKSVVAVGLVAAIATVAVTTNASAETSVSAGQETTAAAFEEAAQGPDQETVQAEPRAAMKEVAKKAAGSFLGSAAWEAATAGVKASTGKKAKGRGHFLRGGVSVANDIEVDLDRFFD